MITIEKYNGINVLRDDLLKGGTKSILMPNLITDEFNEYVYASPVYGGFQIALSEYCKSIGKKATIFCAKRNKLHENTLKCIELGANIIEVKCGYLIVVEKHSRDYCNLTGAKKLMFGANTTENKFLLSNRVKDVINILGEEPQQIWCAIGSGTLVDSILDATVTAKIMGVQVGAEYNKKHNRLTVLKYHKSFDKISNFHSDFQSMKNYDLKAWEYCNKFSNHINQNVLFWNVL
jgi:hypothetical protein